MFSSGRHGDVWQETVRKTLDGSTVKILPSSRCLQRKTVIDSGAAAELSTWQVYVIAVHHGGCLSAKAPSLPSPS